MFADKLIKKLARAIYIHPQIPENIIPDEEIMQLFIKARQSVSNQNNINLTRPGLHGEKLSDENGQGMDYSESRVYSSGDDFRSINWKQSARSNELIVNQFNKEQEPVDYILLDLRPSMYFGCKIQPKISNAIKLVIETITTSLSNGRSLKLFTFNDSLKYQGWLKDFNQAFAIISKLSAYSETDKIPDVININLAIQSIARIKPKYSTITVISDFNDITEETSLTLKSFKENNWVALYQIKDEIELNLPAIYPVDYQSLNIRTNTSIDTQANLKALRKRLDNVNNTIISLLISSSHKLVLVTNDDKKAILS